MLTFFGAAELGCRVGLMAGRWSLLGGQRLRETVESGQQLLLDRLVREGCMLEIGLARWASRADLAQLELAISSGLAY